MVFLQVMPGNMVIRGHRKPGLECGRFPPGDAREMGLPSCSVVKSESPKREISPPALRTRLLRDDQVFPAVYPLIREQVMYYVSVKPFFFRSGYFPECSVPVENPDSQR